MAQTIRVHGDFKPVMNYDSSTYVVGSVNASTSAATVQPQGPKLDFFTISLTGLATDGAVLKSTIEAIQQLAVIYMYEVTDAATDTLAVAVYPTGAWTTGALDAATGGTTVASATFTN